MDKREIMLAPAVWFLLLLYLLYLMILVVIDIPKTIKEKWKTLKR